MGLSYGGLTYGCLVGVSLLSEHFCDPVGLEEFASAFSGSTPTGLGWYHHYNGLSEHRWFGVVTCSNAIIHSNSCQLLKSCFIVCRALASAGSHGKGNGR